MGPAPKRKLSLPSSILKQLEAQQPSLSKGNGRPRRQLSRKEQRKAQRVQKRQSRRPQSPQVTRSRHLNRASSPHSDLSGSDDLDEDDAGHDFNLGSESEGDGSDTDGAGDQRPTQPRLSKSAQEKLSRDDAEIADLERKLGLKGKKSLPKSFKEDGLVSLLDGLGSDEEETGVISKKKRKAEADEWLAQKRRKAQAAASVAAADETSSRSDDSDEEGNDSYAGHYESDDEGFSDLESNSELDNFSHDREEHEDDDNDDDDIFEGLSDEDQAEPLRPQRENPYVAPTTNVAKYVPPSLRKQSGSSNEAETQLRRRVQGLINRLTNDNMIGILKDFAALYDAHPRQTVTSTTVDLVLALVCSPEKRPDSFFTMIAGFVAAMHKAMGMAVSAYFIQQLVEVFGSHYKKASSEQSDSGSKHLISLLAELYNMQVVGRNLIFDYVRLFLNKLSELNTELLLRIIQLCGPSLRREDPHALGDIVNSIKPTNLKSMSVRTSFMIDEMKKLQSNKAKAVTRNRDLADQRTQLRKRIGTLGGTHDAQPLRMSLKDIQDADKHGKWWLVGASWSGSHPSQGGVDNRGGTTKEENAANADDTPTFGDDDLGIPDLWQLAREQGFNTEIRQRIFVALHAATDYENAELLVRQLRLNKHQRKEIPEVIVRSGERQSQYNHYYTLVAARFCGDRELSFQFRRCLTTRLRKMGEDIDTGDGDDFDADDAADYDLRWVYNTAKMFGSLVVSRSLRLKDVVKYRNLAILQEKAHMFFEVMFISMLQECKRDGLKEVFSGLDADDARGVQYFLKKNVRQTDLLKEKKEKNAVRKGCEAADQILLTFLTTESL
ncbi:suppressor of glycerol defect [Parahypoxylon ruwenzoriense]